MKRNKLIELLCEHAFKNPKKYVQKIEKLEFDYDRAIEHRQQETGYFNKKRKNQKKSENHIVRPSDQDWEELSHEEQKAKVKIMAENLRPPHPQDIEKEIEKIISMIEKLERKLVYIAPHVPNVLRLCAEREEIDFEKDFIEGFGRPGGFAFTLTSLRRDLTNSLRHIPELYPYPARGRGGSKGALQAQLAEQLALLCYEATGKKASTIWDDVKSERRLNSGGLAVLALFEWICHEPFTAEWAKKQPWANGDWEGYKPPADS